MILYINPTIDLRFLNFLLFCLQAVTVLSDSLHGLASLLNTFDMLTFRIVQHSLAESLHFYHIASLYLVPRLVWTCINLFQSC